MHAIHSFFQQLFIEYLYGTVLGTKDTAVKKNEIPAFMELTLQYGRWSVSKIKGKIYVILDMLYGGRKERREIKNLGWGL